MRTWFKNLQDLRLSFKRWFKKLMVIMLNAISILMCKIVRNDKTKTKKNEIKRTKQEDFFLYKSKQKCHFKGMRTEDGCLLDTKSEVSSRNNPKTTATHWEDRTLSNLTILPDKTVIVSKKNDGVNNVDNDIASLDTRTIKWTCLT